MNTIAIANQKGGCGKTTTAVNLAAELGLQNQRVLLIDMDPQGHACLGLGISDRDLPGLYEVLSDEVSLYDAILSDVIEGVDLVPANITLAAIEPLLTDQPGRERQLLEHIEPFGNLYDYTLIDCPPSLGLLSVNALRAAQQVLTPVEASLFSLEGIQRLQDIVNLLEDKYRIELSVKVVPTMFDHHTRFAQTILRQIREQLPGGVKWHTDTTYRAGPRGGLLWQAAQHLRTAQHRTRRLPPPGRGNTDCQRTAWRHPR